MKTKIFGGKLICGDEILENTNLYFEDGKISEITKENLPCDFEINAFGKYVSSGFIDIHTHGGANCEFMDEGHEPILKALKLHMSHGTTSIMPTTLTSTNEFLKYSLKNIKSAFESNNDLPNFLGVHLEGPYFSYEQRGAQNPKYLKNPISCEYEKLFDDFGSIIKRMSFAPELPGSCELCEYLSKRGVCMSVGHTNALYEDVLKVYEKGCHLLTHFYSGMSTITRDNGFRKLGVVESGYLLDGMYIEIIADGMHLPPELLKMILKLKDNDKICLVTDSIRGAGQPNGMSYSGRLEDATPCIIEDGVAKLMDRTAFAGSIATTDVLLRTMIKNVGISVQNAIKMITVNPAKVLNLHNKGKLEKEYDADIVIFDEDVKVCDVFVMGRKVC